MYTIIEFDPNTPISTLKEAKLAAVEAAQKQSKSFAVVKLIGYTKPNPSFVTLKKEKQEISTEIPLNARCDFDGKIAVGSKVASTGDTVYLCIDCLGGQ